MVAASVTHPVPWMSSLKQGIRGLYLSRIRLALWRPKSSLLPSVSFRDICQPNLQMNICSGEPLSRDGHEFLDKVVVLFPADSGLSKT